MNARLHAMTLLVGTLLLTLPALLAACSGNGASSEKPETISTSAFSSMSAAERDETVRRLQIQMDYLTEELDVLRDTLDSGRKVGKINDQLLRRYELLSAMYMQRLEAFETLKLELETEARLARSERARPAR